MSRSGGPYADEDDQQLYDLRRELNRAIALPVRGGADRPDWEAQRITENQLSHRLQSVEKEIKFRYTEKEEEKARRREIREKRERGPGIREPDDVLAKYFRATNVTEKMQLNWHLNGAQYLAIYTPTSHLEVWIRVDAGTKDAAVIDEKWYLPANDNKQISKVWPFRFKGS